MSIIQNILSYIYLNISTCVKNKRKIAYLLCGCKAESKQNCNIISLPASPHVKRHIHAIPVSEVDIAIMECEGEVMSRRFHQ